MAENKYLWRASVRRVPGPIYLVAQNMQSAAAQATNHPQVAPEDIAHLQRIDAWDESQNMTIVDWPEPPPEPDPEPEPIP